MNPDAEPTPPTPQEAELIAAALAAQANAHAPYSGFRVGAAIRDDCGAVRPGCNVENAAYPQGQCAEATAIGAMVAAGGRRIEMIVVVGPDGAFCAPCGGCRQRIREFAAEHTPVVIASRAGVLARTTLGELLPASFGPEALEDAAAAQAAP